MHMRGMHALMTTWRFVPCFLSVYLHSCRFDNIFCMLKGYCILFGYCKGTQGLANYHEPMVLNFLPPRKPSKVFRCRSPLQCIENYQMSLQDIKCQSPLQGIFKLVQHFSGTIKSNTEFIRTPLYIESCSCLKQSLYQMHDGLGLRCEYFPI